MSLKEKIEAIEEEIRRTPYNKATEHHIGILKAKLSKLKEEAQKQTGRKSGVPYAVKKTGDATVVIVGFPSVGKSTLLNKLTNADSPVAAYDFTTLKIIPGIMKYKGAKIQILDIPGLISGASLGRGRGREVLSVVRAADLILLLVDVFNPRQLEILRKELYDANIRLDTAKPQIKIKIRERGGIEIKSTVKLTKVSSAALMEVLKEYRIHNAEVVLREDVTLEQFIDAVAGNRVYVPSITALNKIDLVKEDYLREVEKQFFPISADKNINLEKLKEAIFRKLDFIRIFTKPQGLKVESKEPMILRRGATVADICEKLHRDLKKNFKYAQVWGSSVKFGGRRVGLEHVPADGDVITIVKRNI